MNRTADLNATLSFVTDRVNEQAIQSGEPLNVQQSLLLANLPSSTPAIWLPGPETPAPPLVPRDINYERLCALAKTAYLSDRQIQWALAVSRLRNLNHLEVKGSRAGCMPLFLIAGAAAGEAKYWRNCFASSGCFELPATAPENIVIF
jgi:hypothetical protein